MTNSNDKGKDYELKIAKLLSEWTGFKLIRTPMSGAWQGTAGDIKPKNSSDYFPFTVECKKNEDWNFDQVMNGDGLVYSWMDQAVRESKEDREMANELRFPLLIFSRNYRPDYIAIPDTIQSRPTHVLHQCARVFDGVLYWLITTLPHFMDRISYNDFVMLVENAYPEPNFHR